MSDTTSISSKNLETTALGVGGLRPGTVHITFQERVSAKDVHAALDKIFDLNGCTACGFLGLDILLRPQVDIARHFKGIKGVVDVGIVAGMR